MCSPKATHHSDKKSTWTNLKTKTISENKKFKVCYCSGKYSCLNSENWIESDQAVEVLANDEKHYSFESSEDINVDSEEIDVTIYPPSGTDLENNKFTRLQFEICFI